MNRNGVEMNHALDYLRASVVSARPDPGRVDRVAVAVGPRHVSVLADALGLQRAVVEIQHAALCARTVNQADNEKLISF